MALAIISKIRKRRPQHENHLPYVPWRDAFQGDGSGRFGAGVVDLIEDACGKLRIGEALSPIAWEGLFAPKTGIYTTKTFVWFDKYL